MSNILIQNSGELPIWGIRLMGLSNKDESKIGRFGTGLKESIALLARMDNLPIIYSGECRVEFEIQTITGQEEICFKLSHQQDIFGPDTWHPLGIHPNMGHHDWTDPWMIFREIVCNALDESGQESLYHDVVSTEPEGVAGSTRIYIPMSKEILIAYTSIEEKILCLGNKEVTHSTGVGNCLKKGKNKQLQIYTRGVWVQENGKSVSLWDYELRGLKLNESRAADWYDINSSMRLVMTEYTKAQVKTLLDVAIANDIDAKGYHEVRCLNGFAHYLSVDHYNWREAFLDIYGEKAVITTNDRFMFDKIEEAGFKPVVIENGDLYSALKAVGVQSYMHLISKEDRDFQEILTPTLEAQEVYDGIWDKMEAIGFTNGKKKPELKQFRQKHGEDKVIFGRYMKETVYLNRDHQGGVEERRACVEEIAHHSSNADDETRALQTYLVELVERLI
ncbi:MAG: hypothetical protein KAR40_06160 [Candidatus Sabulitectum sp.]|nr:hypothetical protein [Candidatus Sabulitectum sp.]